jgi:hypothetical protein
VAQCRSLLDLRRILPRPNARDEALEPLAKVNLVVMKSVPKRGSVGSLHPQELADATLLAETP